MISLAAVRQRWLFEEEEGAQVRQSLAPGCPQGALPCSGPVSSWHSELWDS